MPLSTSWLPKLNLSELQRLAVLLGTPCSGTKPVRIAGIDRALSQLQYGVNSLHNTKTIREDSLKQISLVSIDMGIRNLAFTHLTTEVKSSGQHTPSCLGSVTVNAWRKIDVGSSDFSMQNASDLGSTNGGKRVSDANVDSLDVEARSPSQQLPTKRINKEAESFDPSIYAGHAFTIINDILNQYKPTHILIERQRFRSGSSSAVLEWTIRVGVFEGMLYAVLKTLQEMNANEGVIPTVEGILPTRVNRFWLEGGYSDTLEQAQSGNKETKVKITGKEVKKAKIMLVGQLLENAQKNFSTQVDPQTNSSLALELGKDIQPLVEYFQSEVQRPANSRRKKKAADHSTDQLASIAVSKLDDLADCLLQGLAWLNWQNNRSKVKTMGGSAFNLSG